MSIFQTFIVFCVGVISASVILAVLMDKDWKVQAERAFDSIYWGGIFALLVHFGGV